MNADADAAVAAVRAHFWEISEFFLKNTRNELEMARAMNDRDDVIRRQVKMEVMKHARSILDYSIQEVKRAGEASQDGPQ